MKFPVFHSTSSRMHPSLGSTGKENEASPGRLKNNFSHFLGIENSIEIQIHSHRIHMFLLLYVLAIWLPIVFLTLHVYNSLHIHVENQGAELEQLKSEVKRLATQVDTLESHLRFHKKPQSRLSRLFKPIMAPQDVSLEADSKVLRLKRSTHEETNNSVKQSISPLKKRTTYASTGRGKQSCKKMRRRCRLQGRRHFMNCKKFSGLQAVHLKGAYPESVVEAGPVGPWFVDNLAIPDVNISSSFHLRQDDDSIEVDEAGVYFIYAQVYYLTSQAFNSFSIMLTPKNFETNIPIAYCSSSSPTTNSPAANSAAEVSCYTALVRSLQSGDRIFLQQREKDRRLITRSGHTFLGFIKLGAVHQK